MPHLKRLPETANVFDVFLAFPRIYAPWVRVTQELFRGPGPISPGDRETIFAFCSRLNACKYCYGSHSQVAWNFGADPGTFDRLIDDIDTAPVADALRPLLKYARKLTETPARMTQADADAVHAAGWDDEALHLTVAICCMANFMNRLVDGSGLAFDPAATAVRAKMLTEIGYAAPFERRMAELKSAGR